jgi:uncharacterized membrane protein
MPRIETAGGEKWMEIAFLNSILRSDTFPPHDPWLSGFAISYYYFGYVIIAMLARLAAVPPPIAFNLGIATLFALTCTGAFSLVYNLVVAKANALGERLKEITAAVGSLLGPLLVTVMGNLEGSLEALHARGIGSATFWAWLDVRSINGPPVALAQGSWLPQRFFWWWQASRVLHDYAPWGADQEVIDEFPSFSFLLGDMHPHVLALPFALLALALALNLYLRVSESADQRSPITSLRFAICDLRMWEFLVYAVCLGGLGFLNTWDFPIYLSIVIAACILAHSRITHHASRFPFYVFRFALPFVTLLVAGILLYLPFWLGFRSQARGILPNLFNGTRLPHFLVMFGPLAFVAAVFVAGAARREGVRAREVARRTLVVLGCIVGTLTLMLGLVVLLIAAGAIPLRGPAAYLVTWLRGEPVAGLGDVSAAQIRRSLLARVIDPAALEPRAFPAYVAVLIGAVIGSPLWVVVGLLALILTAVIVLARGLRPESFGSPPTANGSRSVTGYPSSAISGFVLLLLIAGALLALSVEFFYLRDNFGTRMNTVFKFYFQTWVLWGIAGAYALVQIVRRCGARISTVLLALGVAFYALAVMSGDALAYWPSRRFLVGLPAWPVYAYLLALGLAWALWGAACVCALVAGFAEASGAATVVILLSTLLILAGLVYPAMAIPKRAAEYGSAPTLDGTAYLSQAHPDDYAAIAWLNENVRGAPVILESPGDRFRAYIYEGRVSALTGLPTLLGWAGHESQWRGNYDEQGRREPDIEKLYTSLVPSEVLTLLNKYDITYVYVGPLERSRYPAEGLEKFSALMETVYETSGVSIYRYRPASTVEP